MKWIDIEKNKPQHKDLVLCWNGTITLPAIYFDNKSFCGFYYFTTFYHEYLQTMYSKVKLKDKHKINDVVKWKPIDEPNSK